MRKYLKDRQYSIDEDVTLGKGSFGKVYRGYDHTNAHWVAIKSINLQLLEIHGAQMKTIICNQITVMRKFTKKMQQKPCPYLVKHFDCFRTDTHVYIVMQLCEGGTLNDLLSKGDLAEEGVKTILKQIISGLQYLDALNISHRDLKPQNIFVAVDFANGKNITHFKIGDFGFAAQKQSFSEVLGTYPFMAPEIYKRENYTSKVDVWSLGIIAYQLLFRELYFFGKNKWEIEKKVKETQFVLEEKKRSRISEQMYQFISVCLTKDKEKRPTAAQLSDLPLFSKQQKQLLVIFEALELQLFYCELLRSMAEEICQFGNSSHRGTEFIQIYLLKRAYSIVNLLNYSLMNKRNYLNVDDEQFQVLTNNKYKKEYAELCDKVQKQSILVTALFQDKYASFQKYIDKFGTAKKDLILAVVAAQKHYADIDGSICKAELRKWADLLSKQSQYETLKLKCQKLLQL